MVTVNRKSALLVATSIWMQIVFCNLTLSAQSPINAHTVYNIGNLADVENVSQFGSHLSDLLGSCRTDWTLLLNGDLIDNSRNFNASVQRLDTFINRILENPYGRIIIIPGDRDWQESQMRGLEKVRVLENYFTQKDYERLFFPLKEGCPGPVFFPIQPELNLLLINTQWWNHEYRKPTPESADCDIADEESIKEEIEEFIEENTSGNLILAGHHPLYSNGEYGGSFHLADWFFPVPIVSLFITSFKQNIGGPLQTINSRFVDFRNEMRDMLRSHYSVIYASGHETNVEVIRDEENVYINSGAPMKGGYVRKRKATLMSSRQAGLVAMEYHPNGDVIGLTYELHSGGYLPVDSSILFQAPCLDPEPGIPVNHRLVPCIGESRPTPFEVISHPDHISIAANPNYIATAWQKRMLGQHYRNSWTTPVMTPVLNLDKFAYGIQPYEIGGGRQTKSLKFVANDGLEYVFRSVDKDPAKALSHDLRSTIIAIAVRDQTTTQQPYGALTAANLLDEIGILHAHPKLYAMPNVESLGPFRSQFGGMLGMMEERPVDPKPGGEAFAGATDIKRTVNLFKIMYRDSRNSIRVDEFLRARMFDVLVGDWGKHEDNWKWAGYRKDNGFEYRPIPRDRDHIFSLWDGLIPWLVDREWAKPAGENFDYKIKGLRSLMWQARHLDRFLASEADREDWIAAARYIQQRISESEIETAVRQMPEEIYDLDGKGIENKLKVRIKDLEVYANRYYEMLSPQVDVVGSHREERFVATRNEDGTLQVDVFNLKNDGSSGRTIYQRKFFPNETKEVRLFGLKGSDDFVIKGKAKKSILLRIIPGPDVDYIRDSSSVAGLRRKTLVYNEITGDELYHEGELRSIRTSYNEAYQYNRTTFEYNKYFPLAYLSFSSDNGLSLNTNVTFTNQRYGKPDFSSKHSLGLRVSTIGNVRFEYDATWRSIVGNLDLISGATLERKRRYRYFFGLGNDTRFDRDLLNEDFYTLQYTTSRAYIGLQRNFWKYSYMNIRIDLEGNSKETLEGNILDDVAADVLGEDAVETASLVFELDLDFRDREDLPSRGARFHTQHQISKAAGEDVKTYFVGEGSIEFFATTGPFTLGVKGGGLYSRKDVPYYHLPVLGQNSYLRGFRRNRFSGSSGVFIDSDLRIQLLDRPDALIPHKLGVKFFVDQGRVYYKGETSNTWHVGYGAGIYFVPLRERFALNLSMAFSEEESGLIIFGLGSSF